MSTINNVGPLSIIVPKHGELLDFLNISMNYDIFYFCKLQIKNLMYIFIIVFSVLTAIVSKLHLMAIRSTAEHCQGYCVYWYNDHLVGLGAVQNISDQHSLYERKS